MTSRHLLTAAALVPGLALTIALTAGPAEAISSYQSRSMSCAAIHARIAAEGAVLLRWTQAPNIQRYDRFVHSTSQCFGTQRAVWSSVPAADDPSCSVSICKQCDPRNFWNNGWGGDGC